MKTKQTSGPAKLADAVLLQSFGDVLKAQKSLERFKRKILSYADRDTLLDGEEAYLFLTAEEGPWYTSRTLWCTLSGQDPVHVRTAALARFPKGVLDDITRVRAEDPRGSGV